jgi:hypothetical protein
MGCDTFDKARHHRVKVRVRVRVRVRVGVRVKD